MVTNYDLFVSYADADRAWVEGYLLDALSKAEVSYLTESAFTLGVPRILEFESAIQQSRYTLLVISDAYLDDDLTTFTDVLAQSYGEQTGTWPVIPLTLKKGARLPPRLKMLEGLNAVEADQWKTAIDRICHQLKLPAPAETEKPICPYPGMVPFGEQDADHFFGREDEISQLLEKLRLYPFITVIGASGSGKSSLVFAGLIPRLSRSGLFGTGEWCIRSFRPGSQPIENLNAVVEGTTNSDPVASIRRFIADQPSDQKLLLVIDQFEELFTQATANTADFQQALLAISKLSNVYLVLTVRADFYPDLMGCLLWEKIRLHRFEVTPLAEKGLRQAVVSAAESVQVYVDTALVERLLADAKGEPGVLPLMQETLVLLWEKLERRFLPLKAYDLLVLPSVAYGGTQSQPQTGLQVAVANRADAVLASLETDQKQAIARRIFLRLVQFGEGRPDTRRQQSMAALHTVDDDSSLFNQTLHHLVSYRLLTISGQENADTKVDISHEALINAWPILQDWIDEYREIEQFRRRLEAKADDWANRNKRGGLLDPLEIREIRSLDSDNAIASGFSASLQALVRASVRSHRIKKVILGCYIIAISGFSLLAASQWRSAEIGRIQAVSQSSKAKFITNRDAFEALLDALEAGASLKQLPLNGGETQLKTEVMTALTEAVFWTKERNRLEGHTGLVNSVSYSPDGQTIASAGGDHTIRLWQADGKPIQTLAEHDDLVASVSFHPDGDVLVSGGYDRTLRLWRKNGEVWKEDIEWKKTIDEGKRRIHTVQFSPDGQTIAASADHGKLFLWRLDGTLIFDEKVHQKKVTSLAFSADGSAIATASTDKTVKLWSLKSGKPEAIDTFSGHDDIVNSVSFSSSGNLLASASYDNTVRILAWNQEKLTPVKTFTGHTKGVRNVDFSADGTLLASTGEDNTVRIWQQQSAGINDIALKPDGTTTTTVETSSPVDLWKAGRLSDTLTGHSNFVTSISFGPTGQLLASASNDGTVRVWQPKSPNLTVLNNNVEVKSVRINPANNTVTTADRSNVIKFWQTEGMLTARLTASADAERLLSINNLAFSSDGSQLAFSSDDGNNKAKGKFGVLPLSNQGFPLSSDVSVSSILTSGEDPFSDIQFNINDRTLATAGYRGKIYLWQANGTLLEQSAVDSHDGKIVYSVRFSSDGKLLASAGSDGRVILSAVDGTSSTPLQEPVDGSYSIYEVSFSPDRKLLAGASEDGSVKLWQIEGTSASYLKEFRHGDDAITTVSIHPTAPLLAAGNDKGEIFLWHLDGTLMTILSGHEQYILSLSFSADGQTLASGSDDKTVILWNLGDLSDKSVEGLNLDYWIASGCHWIKDYLKTNPKIAERDARYLCSEEILSKGEPP